MSSPVLYLHDFLPTTRANGPGVRAAVWVQGCSLGCPGCFNPTTHSFEGGKATPVDELVQRIVALGDAIEGVTVSGGEPLQQRPALLGFLTKLKARTDLSVLVFTGFTWEEMQQFPEMSSLLKAIDVLIAGRYDADKHQAHSLVGSSNKTVHLLTGRYGLSDLQAIPPAEVVLTTDGEILVTGIDPLLVRDEQSG